jgi:hypothetical protein
MIAPGTLAFKQSRHATKKHNIETTLSDSGLLIVDVTREIRNFLVAAFIVDRLQVLENADDLKVFLVNLNGEKTFDSMVHYPFIHTRLSQFCSLIKNRNHDEFHLPGPVWLRITLPPSKPVV